MEQGARAGQAEGAPRERALAPPIPSAGVPPHPPLGASRPTPRRRSVAWVVGAALLALLLVLATVAGGATPAPQAAPLLLGAALLALVAWLVLRARSDRRTFEAELQRRAAADAVTADRLAIARDLHDVVSHGLGLVTVRSAVGLRLAERDPAAAVDALRDVEQVSRRATEDLRRMLHLLTEQDPTSGSGSLDPRHPAPQVSEIPSLAAQLNQAGVSVEVDCDETAAGSDGAAVTAYRIVQEALDNVARHAGPTRARVEVSRRGDDLVVEVSDAGRAEGWQANPGAGHGLALMRRRAEAFGGRVSAGPHGAGWRVTATLPDPGSADE